MDQENIEYRCSAACKHNGRTNTYAYAPCHLKNKELKKKDKDTRVCYGNMCGFFVPNTNR